jgi:hypothetical protein
MNGAPSVRWSHQATSLRTALEGRLAWLRQVMRHVIGQACAATGPRQEAAQRDAVSLGAALSGPPDTPGVPCFHPLHAPHQWATVHHDAPATQTKLVRYEQWLCRWAKHGRYTGGTQLVHASEPPG